MQLSYMYLDTYSISRQDLCCCRVSWFLLSALIIGIIGLLLTRKKPENKNFYAREGMVVVALGWVGISILGAVPYVATGSIPNVVNALFESVSGFSTTGASILADVESLPSGYILCILDLQFCR